MYRDIVFLQNHEADEVLDILDKEGIESAFRYLAQWDYGEGEYLEVEPYGRVDTVEHIDNYIISYNKLVGYIGLSEVVKEVIYVIVKNIEISNLNEALAVLNIKYCGNIKFKSGPSQIGSNRIRFTISVNNSKGPGGRTNRTGGRVTAACWHVHGDLFDIILDLYPKAVIMCSRRLVSGEQTRVYKDDYGDIQGNWQDWNIGSYYAPFMYSKACNC